MNIAKEALFRKAKRAEREEQKIREAYQEAYANLRENWSEAQSKKVEDLQTDLRISRNITNALFDAYSRK